MFHLVALDTQHGEVVGAGAGVLVENDQVPSDFALSGVIADRDVEPRGKRGALDDRDRLVIEIVSLLAGVACADDGLVSIFRDVHDWIGAETAGVKEVGQNGRRVDSAIPTVELRGNGRHLDVWMEAHEHASELSVRGHVAEKQDLVEAAPALVGAGPKSLDPLSKRIQFLFESGFGLVLDVTNEAKVDHPVVLRISLPHTTAVAVSAVGIVSFVLKGLGLKVPRRFQTAMTSF